MPKNKNIIQLSCLTDRVPDAESKPMATGYTHWKPFHTGGLEQISAGPSGDQNEQASSQLSGFWVWMGWAVGVCEEEGQWAPLSFCCVLGMSPALGGKSSLGNDFHQNRRVNMNTHLHPQLTRSSLLLYPRENVGSGSDRLNYPFVPPNTFLPLSLTPCLVQKHPSPSPLHN